ncbi:MAG: hypothetical protein ABIH46_02445 [Chloroflexota bacterium]
MLLCLAWWVWKSENGMSFWTAPYDDKRTGGIDARSLPQCGKAGGRPEGFGLFCYERPPNGLDVLGELDDDLSHDRRIDLKRLFDREYGIRLGDIPQIKVQDFPWLLFVYEGDPTGQDRWKPLRGSLRAGIRLHLAGKVVRQEAFDHKHPAWKGTLAVFQEDYRRLREQCLEVGSDQYLRFLDAKQESYRVPWEVLLEGAGGPMEAPLPHRTVITESFTGDGDVLGYDLTWTEVRNDWDRVGGNASLESFSVGLRASARAESALSSDGHYAQLDISTLDTPSSGTCLGGVAFRFAAAAETFYCTVVTHTSNLYTQKSVAGTLTTLDGPDAITISLPDTIYGESTEDDYFTSKWNGVIVHGPTLQTSITGELLTGINGYLGEAGNAGKFKGDNFKAGDLAVVTTVAVSDSLSLTDQVRSPKVYFFLSDSLALTDVPAIKAKATVADSLSISEVPTVKPYISIADVLALSITPSVGASLKITDSLALTELAAVKGYLKVLDSLALTEVPSITLFRLISDSLALTDALALKAKVPLSDTLALTELVLAPKATLRVADGLTLTETLALTASLRVSDTLSLTDLQAILARLAIADAMALTETLRMVVTLLILDSLSLTVRAPAIAASLSVLETLTLTDVPSIAVKLAVADALTLAEALSVAAKYAKAISDSLSLTESIAAPRVVLSITEALALAETLSKVISGRLILVQIVGRAINASDIIITIDPTVIEIPADVQR